MCPAAKFPALQTCRSSSSSGHLTAGQVPAARWTDGAVNVGAGVSATVASAKNRIEAFLADLLKSNNRLTTLQYV